jgi:serine/threonine protein kinase
VLEHILDGTMEPTNLPFELLKNITNNFSEEQKIGQGGFGSVYKGILKNGTVAVKRIFNSHTIDVKLFQREVNNLLDVNHENVVRFLGYCASTEEKAMRIEGVREYIYAEMRERILCFEYISNGSLSEHITGMIKLFSSSLYILSSIFFFFYF